MTRIHLIYYIYLVVTLVLQLLVLLPGLFDRHAFHLGSMGRWIDYESSEKTLVTTLWSWKFDMDLETSTTIMHAMICLVVIVTFILTIVNLILFKSGQRRKSSFMISLCNFFLNVVVLCIVLFTVLP